MIDESIKIVIKIIFVITNLKIFIIFKFNKYFHISKNNNFKSNTLIKYFLKRKSKN